MRLIIDEKTDRFLCSDEELADLREYLAKLKAANRVVAYTRRELREEAIAPHCRP